MATIVRPLGATLGPLRGSIARHLKTGLKNEGNSLTLEQMIILKMIRYCNGVMVQQDIAEKLGKDKSVILRMVDALAKDGFIQRVVDSNDKRRNILEITPNGHALTDRFNAVEMKVSEDLLSGLSDDEIELFFSVVEKIKANGEKL